MNIGVLALQGDFAEHLAMLAHLGVDSRAVRLPDQLAGLDGLIIPGGESTTMGKLAVAYGLLEPLRAFGQEHAIWGTCAGAILLSKDAQRDQPLLGLMDITVARNAFGRQVDSFEVGLDVPGAVPGGPGGAPVSGGLHPRPADRAGGRGGPGAGAAFGWAHRGRPAGEAAGHLLPPRAERGRSLPSLFFGDGKIGIRSFRWPDLLTVHRYRKQILGLDSAQALTRGIPLGPLGFFALLNPRQGAYTAVGRAGKAKPVIGQMRYLRGTDLAKMSFLLPVDELDTMVLPSLLEALAYKAGEWGAFHFTAEIDEDSCVFEALRRAGFSIYAWQRLWKFPAPKEAPPPRPAGESAWSPLRRGPDLIGVRSLYHSLVPALVQPVEIPPDKRTRGLIYQRGSDLLAYTEIVYGPLGIWTQPFVHPATEEVMGLMADLVQNIPHRGRRPVYICVRSYQSWFESSLEDLNAERGPRQALMVKHLAISQRVTSPLRVRGLEKARAKHATPVVNLDTEEAAPAEVARS